MKKSIVIGTTAVVVVAVAGGGSYMALHIPKRQFNSSLTKMTENKDNIADFRVKVNGDDMSAKSISGKMKFDAKHKNNMDLVMNVTDKQTQKMHIKANNNHAYLSASYVANTLQATSYSGAASKIAKSLDPYWLSASDTSSYETSKLKPGKVKSDTSSLTEWFKDLDGKKFEKVSDGYRVNLNKADMKRLMTKISKTKSGKDIPKSEWKEYKSSLDDINGLKFGITTGKSGHLLKMNFSGKEDGQLGRVTFNLNTKRDDKLRVKMPAANKIKSESELSSILQDKMADYYKSQYDNASSSASSSLDI